MSSKGKVSPFSLKGREENAPCILLSLCTSSNNWYPLAYKASVQTQLYSHMAIFSMLSVSFLSI